MLSRFVIVAFCLAACTNALSINHNHRGIAHRDLAQRFTNTSVTKRSNKKRCKARPTTAASSSTPNVAAVLSTSTKASSTVTPTTTKVQPTTTADPTTTKAKATTTADPTTTKAPATTKASTSTTSSSKAASTTAASSSSSSSSDLPSFMVGTQTGQGTYYTAGLGACGITNTDNDYIAAASQLLFDRYPGYNGENPNNNPMCGKKVKVTYNGNTIIVALTDRCTACKVDDLDFTPTAFEQLAPLSVGRLDNIQWDWLD